MVHVLLRLRLFQIIIIFRNELVAAQSYIYATVIIYGRAIRLINVVLTLFELLVGNMQNFIKQKYEFFALAKLNLKI